MKPTPEQNRRLRTKNIVVALLLVAFVVMLYFLTMVRMSGTAPS
jgi:ABC-type transport system involved in cytochrome c biogenesis permease subunit